MKLGKRFLALATAGAAALLLGGSLGVLRQATPALALNPFQAATVCGNTTDPTQLTVPVSPLTGLMTSQAQTPVAGVASLGTRPTVDGTEPLLEVHVFDFSGDLYGRRIEVEFVAKLRDEVKFDSLEAMTVQMQIDAARARDLLSKVQRG